MRIPDLKKASWVPWALAGVGLVLLGVGAGAVLASGEGASAFALVVAGALLLIAPLVLDRIQNLSVGTKGIEIKLTQELVELGAPGTATLMERSGLGSLVASYQLVHESLSDAEYREAKVRLQDGLVDKAADVARNQKFDAHEVRRLFAGGPPTMRVLALGLMEGDTSLADSATMFAAISQSQSGNEQYHGLKLATMLWRNVPPAERLAVLTLIEADSYIWDDADRKELAVKLGATRPHPSGEPAAT